MATTGSEGISLGDSNVTETKTQRIDNIEAAQVAAIAENRARELISKQKLSKDNPSRINQEILADQFGQAALENYESRSQNEQLIDQALKNIYNVAMRSKDEFKVSVGRQLPNSTDTVLHGITEGSYETMGERESKLDERDISDFEHFVEALMTAEKANLERVLNDPAIDSITKGMYLDDIQQRSSFMYVLNVHVRNTGEDPLANRSPSNLENIISLREKGLCEFVYRSLQLQAAIGIGYLRDCEVLDLGWVGVARKYLPVISALRSGQQIYSQNPDVRGQFHYDLDTQMLKRGYTWNQNESTYVADPQAIIKVFEPEVTSDATAKTHAASGIRGIVRRFFGA